VSLQVLENKSLSWGIIGKSASLLAEITIRKSQEADTLSFKKTEASASLGKHRKTGEKKTGE